jgi:hypothetical protein
LNRLTAISDIDFKEDTNNFFSDENLEQTPMLLQLCTNKPPTVSAFISDKANSYQALEKCKGVQNSNTKQTYLLYHHQSLDAFINEKKTILKKYNDCDCTKLTQTEECIPLCPSKNWMLSKFHKYVILFQYYDEYKKNELAQRNELVQKMNEHKKKLSGRTFVPGKGLVQNSE